jgi:hypothetical protein
MKFKSDWWTAVLPDSYLAEVNEYCVDIIDLNEIGILQLSAHRKDDGEITLADLLEFALDEAERSELEEFRSDAFFGYFHETRDNKINRRKWWIASGRTMLYATYQCDSKAQDVELDSIDAIIKSLRVTD